MVAVEYPLMRIWKILGVAGLVGLAAAGATVGTQKVQRQRRNYREADPGELRNRLHERLRAAG
ncbi:MAG: hypothetical protein ACI83Y_002156 [Candidatus Azotimanducaceae bacterium]|jgi:hypothetical protein